MRFAILGLSLSHPYAFAEYLTSRGHRIAAVWDYDPERARAFAAQHQAAVAATPEEAVAAGVDGVIVTSITRDHAAHARLALARGLPVYVDKLLALNQADAEELVQMGPLVMAGSALRFLPDFQALAGAVKSQAIGLPLAADARVYHGMKAYLQEPHTWQDDPALSGGVLVNMGIHAVDLLVAALGPTWQVAAATRARRVHQQALSEDQGALLLTSPNGQLATIRVVCGLDRHGYGLTVTGSEGDLAWQLPDPARPTPNVYAPMVDVFVDAIHTQTWPVPPAEMVAAVRILAAARNLASPELRGEPV